MASDDGTFRPPLDALREWAAALAANIKRRNQQIAELRTANDADAELLAALGKRLPVDEAPIAAPAEAADDQKDRACDLTDMSPTEALRTMLRANPRSWFGPSQALDKMVKHHFATEAKQPSGLIRCLLHRLAGKGEVEVKGYRRSRKYRMKQEQQEAAGIAPQSPLAQDARQ